MTVGRSGEMTVGLPPWAEIVGQSSGIVGAGRGGGTRIVFRASFHCEKDALRNRRSAGF
jgi:hypothetical protein